MKLNVGVFLGGSSVEHEISVISALQAIHALNKDKYNPIPIYINKDGNLYTGEGLLTIDNFKNLEKLLSTCTKITIARNGDSVYCYKNPPTMLGKNILKKLDVAFPIVHGTNCEDGTLQGFLELLKIPYVGSDVFASAVGMDKAITKSVLKDKDIPVLDYLSFTAREWNTDSKNIIQKIESKIGYPVIVKPANLGSSVGIKKAKNLAELENSVDFALSFSTKLVVERAIVKLKEVNCSVMGDADKATASVCEEPMGSDEILSYSDKYMSKSSSKGMSSTKRKLPAVITKEEESFIKDTAVKTFKAIGCSGVARIDFLIDLDNKNKIYVNEINTIPGSLSFYLWEASGISFGELLDELISLAFRRERERQKLVFTYDTNIFSMTGAKGCK